MRRREMLKAIVEDTNAENQCGSCAHAHKIRHFSLSPAGQDVLSAYNLSCRYNTLRNKAPLLPRRLCRVGWSSLCHWLAHQASYEALISCPAVRVRENRSTMAESAGGPLQI